MFATPSFITRHAANPASAKPVEKYDGRHRDHRYVDALAVHAFDFRIGVEEFRVNRCAVLVVAHELFRVTVPSTRIW
jgi:hypothetical protein